MAASHLVTARSARPAAVAACAAALLAALAWQAARPACCRAPAAVAVDVAGARARPPAGAQAGRGAPASAAPPRAASATGGDSGALRALLRRAPADLRASVLLAQSRHADGGRLYARHLLRQCAAADSIAGLHAPEGDDPAQPTPPDGADPRVARALLRVQQLRAACRQFTPAELASGLNIVRNDGGDADPLLARLDRFGVAPQDARAQLLRVLSRPDPLLLQEIGPRLLQHADAGETAYWFDGWRIAPEVAEPALALLPCAFGLPCDDGDPQVWTACLQGQGCADSREALVLRQAAPEDAQRQREILALAARLSQAVKTADIERFVARAPTGR